MPFHLSARLKWHCYRFKNGISDWCHLSGSILNMFDGTTCWQVFSDLFKSFGSSLGACASKLGTVRRYDKEMAYHNTPLISYYILLFKAGARKGDGEGWESERGSRCAMSEAMRPWKPWQRCFLAAVGIVSCWHCLKFRHGQVSKCWGCSVTPQVQCCDMRPWDLIFVKLKYDKRCQNMYNWFKLKIVEEWKRSCSGVRRLGYCWIGFG